MRGGQSTRTRTLSTRSPRESAVRLARKLELTKMKVLVMKRSTCNLKAIFPFNFTRGDFQSTSFGARKGKQSISYSKLNVSSKMKMAIILSVKT